MNGTKWNTARRARDARGRPAITPAADDRILTSREARAFLRIGRTKLHELTRAQQIPAYRIGDGRTSGLRYLRSDLLAWLVGRKV